MRVIASPSNSAQTKIAASRVRELVELVGADDVRDARVAVVLPDKNLLFPLLYALPESLSEVNLTMGYSLRLTSVASFCIISGNCMPAVVSVTARRLIFMKM